MGHFNYIKGSFSTMFFLLGNKLTIGYKSLKPRYMLVPITPIKTLVAIIKAVDFQIASGLRNDGTSVKFTRVEG